MSEAVHSTHEEQAVVGEPASEPHQAAVVGEPQQDMTPVLGEPVPALANGVKDQEPVVSATAMDEDEPASNGVQVATSVFNPQQTPEEVPASPPASQASGTLDDLAISSSEAVTEVCVEPLLVGTNSTEESNPPREAPVTMEAEGAPTEIADAVQEPIHEEAAISHIDDEVSAVSDPPLAEVPSENPYQALEDPSAMENASLDEASIASEAPKSDSPLGEPEDSEEQSSMLEGKPQEVTPTEQGFTIERVANDVEGNSMTEALEGNSMTEAEREASAEVSHRDALLQESHTSTASPEVENTASDDAMVDCEKEVPSAEQKVVSGEENSFQQSQKVVGLPEEAVLLESLTEENVNHHNGGDQAGDRELVPQGSDEKDLTVKEKTPSFGMKLPLVITGLVVAAVGVAFASFRRPH